MKTYKTQTDKYGTYYKCLICYARSESEPYIKGMFCHEPIIKQDSIIGAAGKEELHVPKDTSAWGKKWQRNNPKNKAPKTL